MFTRQSAESVNAEQAEVARMVQAAIDDGSLTPKVAHAEYERIRRDQGWR